MFIENANRNKDYETYRYIKMYINIFERCSLEANISHVFKVDGGDSVSVPRIYHVASRTPLLGVSIELQDLVIDSAIITLAT